MARYLRKFANGGELRAVMVSAEAEDAIRKGSVRPGSTFLSLGPGSLR